MLMLMLMFVLVFQFVVARDRRLRRTQQGQQGGSAQTGVAGRGLGQRGVGGTQALLQAGQRGAVKQIGLGQHKHIGLL